MRPVQTDSKNFRLPCSLEELQGLLALRLNTQATDRALDEQTPPRRLCRRLSISEQQDIISRYEQGETAINLAQTFNISKTGLLKLLRDGGVPVRARGRRTGE